MKPGNQKAKGNAFERKIAKKLSLWITEGSRDDCVYRSAGSGSVFTVRRKKGTGFESQIGDLTAIDSTASWLLNWFAFELKHYASLKVHGLIWGTSSTLLDFWLKHKSICYEYHKNPILVVKENGKPDLILLSDSISSELPQCESAVYVPKYGLTIFHFEEFLNLVPYTIFYSRMQVKGFTEALMEESQEIRSSNV